MADIIQQKKKKPASYDEIDQETGEAIEPASESEKPGVLSRLRQLGTPQPGTATENPFPTTEELQSSKQARRQTAGNITDTLADKGYPTLGAIGGALVDTSADMIPDTQEDYTNSLTTSMGTVGRPSGKILSIEEDELRRMWNGLSGEARESLYKNNFGAFAKDKLAENAQNVKQVTKSAAENQAGMVRSNPTPPPGPIKYTGGVQATERRAISDPSRIIETPKQVADVKSGTVSKLAEQGAPPPANVKEASFPTYEGPSHQETMRMNARNKLADELLKRTRK